MPWDLRSGIVLPAVRFWRVRRMLSQDELAAKAHVARGTIQRVEQGLPVKVTTAARLARALHVDREVLIGSPPPETRVGDE